MTEDEWCRWDEGVQARTKALRCRYEPDGSFIPGCMGALYDPGQCTCDDLEAEIGRVQAELGRLRRQLQREQAARTDVDLRREARRLRAEVSRLQLRAKLVGRLEAEVARLRGER